MDDLTEEESKEVMDIVKAEQWDEWDEGETPGPCANSWTYNQLHELYPDDEEFQMTSFKELWFRAAALVRSQR
jgi:hypothetical protein